MGGKLETIASRKPAAGLTGREGEHSLGRLEVARDFLRRDEEMKKTGISRDAWGLLRGAEIKGWEAAGDKDDALTSMMKWSLLVARIQLEGEMEKIEAGR